MPFSYDTSELDKMLANRSAQNEIERQQLLENVLLWLDQYGPRHGIQSAYIFGSLVQPGRFHQNSDIDIAVEHVNAEVFFSVISLISEAMGRDVDVIELSKCPFENRIRQAGIQWIATNSSS